MRTTLPGAPMLRMTLLMAITLAILVATLARPAEAAFPGVNGKIAFKSSRITADNPQGDYEIYSMKPDGTEIKPLTSNNWSDSDPDFCASTPR
jgi:hypothetical protein